MSTGEGEVEEDTLQNLRPTGMSVADLLSAPSDSSASTSIDSTMATKRTDEVKETNSKSEAMEQSPSRVLPTIPMKRPSLSPLEDRAIATTSIAIPTEPNSPSVLRVNSSMETTTLTSGEGVAAYQYTAMKQIRHQREHIEYKLRIREQPKHSRMCGVGEKADRRPIDPAPIIQLRVIVHDHPPPQGWSAQSKGKEKSSQDVDDIRVLTSKSVNNLGSVDGKGAVASTTVSSPSGQKQLRRGVPVESSWGPGWEDKTWYLENPYYFMYAVLAHAEVDEELHLLQDGKTRYTTGSCVSCLYHLKDVDGSQQGFFVFPDLSIRVEGRYRLKLCLFETVGHEVHHCTSIFTSPFNVYTAKRFPGMEESTMLSRSFADQGLKVRIRKTPRIRRGRVSGSKRKDMLDSEDDSDERTYRTDIVESYSTSTAGQHMRAFPGLIKRPRNESTIEYYPPIEHQQSMYEPQPRVPPQRQVSYQQQSQTQSAASSRVDEQPRAPLSQPQRANKLSASPPEQPYYTHREYPGQQQRIVEGPFSKPLKNLQTPASEMTSRQVQGQQQLQRQGQSEAEQHRSRQSQYPRHTLPPPVGESYYQARPEIHRPIIDRGPRRSPPSQIYGVGPIYEEQRGAEFRGSRSGYEQASQPYFPVAPSNAPVSTSSITLREYSRSPRPAESQHQDARRDRERMIHRFADETSRLNNDPRVTLPPLNVNFQADQRQFYQQHRSSLPTSSYPAAGHARSDSLTRADPRMQQHVQQGSYSYPSKQSPKLSTSHQQIREEYRRNNNNQ